MQDYRERRRQKVTHQGSRSEGLLGEPRSTPPRDVPAAVAEPKEDPDAITTPPRPLERLSPTPLRCTFCQRPLPPFARRTFLARSQRALRPP